MRRLILLLAICSCEDRTVSVTAPQGTRIEVSTGTELERKACEVSVTVATPPTLLFLPMPIPYEKVPVTAEKPL